MGSPGRRTQSDFPEPPDSPPRPLNTHHQAPTGTPGPLHPASHRLSLPLRRRTAAPPHWAPSARGSPLPALSGGHLRPALAPLPTPGCPVPSRPPERLPRRRYRPVRPAGASPLPWGQAAAAGHHGSCSLIRRGGSAARPAPPHSPLFPWPRTPAEVSACECSPSNSRAPLGSRWEFGNVVRRQRFPRERWASEPRGGSGGAWGCVASRSVGCGGVWCVPRGHRGQTQPAPNSWFGFTQNIFILATGEKITES